jgi:hypothetical protein
LTTTPAKTAKANVYKSVIKIERGNILKARPEAKAVSQPLLATAATVSHTLAALADLLTK